MEKSLITLVGKKPGNTTVIMTGVHGNERSGLAAFEKIIPTLQITSGTVHFIVANIKALEQNVRFVEKNMNRCFRKKIKGHSYEENRARAIRTILNTADVLLDIHNTTNKTSEAFLIGEKKEWRKFFPVQKFLSGIDAVEPGGSDGYMLNIGKVGFCLESGSIYDPNGPMIAETSLINFLKLTGNIEGKAEILAKNQDHIACSYLYTCKTEKFRLAKIFKDFDPICSGEIIGYDGIKKIMAKEDGLLLFAHDSDEIGKECFIFCIYK